jgi:HPt (histidine-containing phosphotransfer) domain-containing protein
MKPAIAPSADPAHIGAPAEEEPPVIDERVMKDWRDDLDPEDIAALLARVPDECATCLAAIKEAIANSDVSKARRMAHRLKGMASNLGAARLAHVARRIEVASRSIGDVARDIPRLEATLRDTMEAVQHYS